MDGKVPLSVEMAFRLSTAFGSSPEVWLCMQMAYDLWQARELEESPEVTRMAPPAA
jgi:addiction module HigA family antidote